MSLTRFVLYSAVLSTAACQFVDRDAREDIDALNGRIQVLETQLAKMEERQASRMASASSERVRKGAPEAGKTPQPKERGGAQQAKSGRPGEGGEAQRATVELSLTGDAAAVLLSGQKRRFKAPGKVPAGKYFVLAAFGEGELEKRNEIMLPREGGDVTLHCTEATGTCAVQ